MARVRQFPVERPETADKALRMLRYRLGKVAARRRDRTDYGNRTFLTAKRGDAPRPLVEFSKPRRKIRGESFLGGHLLHSAGKLAQCLRPPRRRVCHYRDVHSHIAVILGKRYSRIKRNLARRDRHIRRVGDENRSFHERASRARVDKGRKFRQNVRHLVSAFAASDVHNQIGVAPLRDRVLRHRLSRSESARNRGSATFGKREENVDDALPRHKRLADRELLRERTGAAQRPIMGKLQLLAEFGRPDNVVNGIFAGTRERLERLSADKRRNHNLVENRRRFLHGSENHARLYRASLGDTFLRVKRPLLLLVDRLRTLARNEERAGILVHRLQRPLDSIVNRSDKPGAKPQRQRTTVRYDLLANLHAGIILVDLYRRHSFVLADYLPDDFFVANINHVVQAAAVQSLGIHNRTGNSRNFSFYCAHSGNAPPNNVVASSIERESRSSRTI